MARFSGPEKQALRAIKAIQKSGALKSTRTGDNYKNRLLQVAKSDYLKINNIRLYDLSPAQAIEYLEIRGQEVRQKTLDMERQAIQSMFRHVTQKLGAKETLKVIKSEKEQVLNSRAYTPEQIKLIQHAQNKINALSTQIAYAAGLRAHELLTLRPAKEQPADTHRDNEKSPHKFKGREGQYYTVKGKGGLTRVVIIPNHLAQQLEATRLENPKAYTDRSVHYTQYYNINGGNRWSRSFTRASNKQLGWSNGAHGVRHQYAQERMVELQVNYKINREEALKAVSQEMGHFRPGITEVYLR